MIHKMDCILQWSNIHLNLEEESQRILNLVHIKQFIRLFSQVVSHTEDILDTQV